MSEKTLKLCDFGDCIEKRLLDDDHDCNSDQLCSGGKGGKKSGDSNTNGSSDRKDKKMSKFLKKGNPHREVLVGTFAYLAPEVITDRNYSEKSDIYALGVCLFIMLTGCFPYNINEDEAQKRKWLL
jgi:serine/threonine protein kinase